MLIASMGGAPTGEERELFQSVTDRERLPLKPTAEDWNIAGRRSGKTRAAATKAAYLAALCDWLDYLGNVSPVDFETNGSF